MFYRLTLTLILISFTYQVQAQQDLGIHFMDGVWQSNITNPANLPQQKIVFALPGFYNQIRIDNFKYNEVIRDVVDPATRTTSTIVDLDNVLEQLGPENIIRNQADIPTFSIGVKINNVFLSFGHTIHTNAYLNYPKELAEVIWNGNAQFIGQTVEIGPDVLLQAYHSYAIGGTGQIAPGLNIGGRFKILSGIADLSSNRRSFQLNTDDDIYQTNVIADYVVNNTGTINYDGFDTETNIGFNDGSFDFDDLLSSNYGLAFDLGIRYQTERWSLAVSALDLGAITWRDDANNIRLQGEFTFEGLDIVKDALVDSISTITVVDSLEAAFDVEETTANYTTRLPNKYYFSAAYQLDRAWTIGMLAYAERFREEWTSTFALSLNAKVGNFMNFGLLYSFTEEEPYRFGANTALRLGPVQLMAATDNLLTAFQIDNSNTANFRFGLNLVFGNPKRDKDDINSVGNQDDFFR